MCNITIVPKLGILKTRTSNHAQRDGQVKRLNRTLMEILSKYVHHNKKDWDEHILMILLAYRSCRSETTKLSPEIMTFEGELVYSRWPGLWGTPGLQQQWQEPSQNVANIERSKMKILEIAINHIRKASDKQEREYDLKLYKNNYKKALHPHYRQMTGEEAH